VVVLPSVTSFCNHSIIDGRLSAWGGVRALTDILLRKIGTCNENLPLSYVLHLIAICTLRNVSKCIYSIFKNFTGEILKDQTKER
jgi:hypothetical protein